MTTDFVYRPRKENSMTRGFLALQFAFVGSVFAQVSAAPDRAPIITPSYRLQCPTGTHQEGGVKSGLGLVACTKDSTDGTRVFQGPMISLWASGRVEAIGQVQDGRRTGRWTLYDETGFRVGETEFLRGDYHGRRVEYFRSGALKLEENWVNGRRQGTQKSWSATGALMLAEYKDDHPALK